MVLKGNLLNLSTSRIRTKIWLCERVFTTRMTPPNILVRIDNVEEFQSQKEVLNSVLQKNTYTIYQLDERKLHKQAWLNNCSLLVYGVKTISSSEMEILDTYLKECNGKILIHAVNCGKLEIAKSMKEGFLDKDFPELMCYKDSLGTNFVVKVEKKLSDLPFPQLMLILKSLHIDVTDEDCKKDDLHEEDINAFLFTSNVHQKVSDIFDKLEALTDGVYSIRGKKQTILLTSKLHTVTKKMSGVLNVRVNNQYEKCPFKWLEFEKHLKTKYFGRNVIYCDILPSTQSILTDLPVNVVKVNGLTVAARQQTCGKGRSGNDWLSPVGCLMFSMQVNIPIQSTLGQKLSFIQHIVVVAFVKSIKARLGYDKLDLSIKWPNDIYVNGKTKVGGVIVNSSSWGNTFKAVVGLGVNISNTRPTSCLNDLIRQANESGGVNLPHLTIEEVFAGTLNHMEELVNVFQGDCGVERFKREYYRYWMHNDAEVTLESYGNQSAAVIGIDEYGYLLARLRNGSEVSFQPDGNRFDMMTNMISFKT